MVLNRTSGSLRLPGSTPAGEPRTSAEFAKMSGAGNDFVVIDDRRGLFGDDVAEFVRRVCSRRLSVGADGVLFLRPSRRAQVRVDYYNADGGAARFCANGTRCAARFAFVNVIAGARMTLETGWGVVGAEVQGDRVTLSLPPVESMPRSVAPEVDGAMVPAEFLVVGVPHLVHVVPPGRDLSALDVPRLGRALRFHPDFAPDGANVHFVRVLSEHEGEIRSYERGVEDETLACGSGVVAAALAGFAAGRFRPPAMLLTRSGIPLEVSADVLSGVFDRIRLSGDARMVFRSTLTPETTGGFPLPPSNPGD